MTQEVRGTAGAGQTVFEPEGFDSDRADIAAAWASLLAAYRAGRELAHVPVAQAVFLEPYRPLLRETCIVAHLGQSVDGCIATRSGHSIYVTGTYNIDHLHRLRALCDAVLLGAGSVAADDPRLTVRRVEGDSPVRVILDPRGTLASPRRVFDDGAAPTLLAVTPAAAVRHIGEAERLVVPAAPDGGLDLESLVAALAARGLRRLFIEGGGVTVTRFVEAGLVDRLHIAVAPVLIGRGVPGLQLVSADTMDDARRPPCRVYRHGDDVLWEFDLAALRTGGDAYDGGNPSTS